jgi:hypothetical protein
MKVLKSTIHKLEVERPCGCKIAGDYEDVAYKQSRGVAIFTACEKHTEGASLVEELLREVLEKEALEAKAPEVVAPSALSQAIATSQAFLVEQAAAAAVTTNGTIATVNGAPVAGGPPVRTLKTAGSSGSAGREQNNRSGYASPAIGRGSQHRPETRQPSLAGGFRRTSSQDASAGHAGVAKTAAAPSGLSMDIGMEVPEDPRLTRILASDDLFGGDPTEEEL